MCWYKLSNGPFSLACYLVVMLCRCVRFHLLVCVPVTPPHPVTQVPKYGDGFALLVLELCRKVRDCMFLSKTVDYGRYGTVRYECPYSLLLRGVLVLFKRNMQHTNYVLLVCLIYPALSRVWVQYLVCVCVCVKEILFGISL